VPLGRIAAVVAEDLAASVASQACPAVNRLRPFQASA